jgi:hypothetical protein
LRAPIVCLKINVAASFNQCSSELQSMLQHGRMPFIGREVERRNCDAPWYVDRT